MLAWLMVAWGGYVFMATGTIDGEIYKYMRVFATLSHWGALGFATGIYRLVFLAINGMWRRTPIFRFVGCMLGMMWWLVLFGAFYAAIQDGARSFPAMIMYPVFIYFEGLSCFRCGQDAQTLRSLSRTTAPDAGAPPSG